MSSRFHRVVALLLLAIGTEAIASGPRWVTGQPYYYPEGNSIVWYTDSPQYFTDTGDLSVYVNNAAANAIVAAAAGVWIVPTSRLNLLYGGALDEHASAVNVYPTSTGLVFPADVQSTNYLAKQIAVLYDSDGAITDMMLGQGASDPSGCRQNAVTESVDSISTSGKIQHAILVLNGRCTGAAPEQQLQLQYQLMRAFGRVIGLGWSQTNDNVFTGNPAPTYNQALYWPIMHPIDIICGAYSYQCMPQPFTLRDDDISGLGLLYPVWVFAPPAPGKTNTLARGSRVTGTVTFPNGQGMQGVNVVIHRLEPSWDTPEAWESTSGVSGYLFRRHSPNPVNGGTTSSTTDMGSSDSSREGYYEIFRTPLYDWEVWQNLILSTQPINPLYVGPYAVGPYDSNSVEPSGSVVQQEFYVTQSYSQETINFPITDAATGCQTTQDGTESATAMVPLQGWWIDNLCEYGHTAWSTLAVKANRALTVEVTALDEQFFATSAKTMPVIGVWNSTDAVGTLPTIAATPGAFNGGSTGITSLTAQITQLEQLRIAIADERGDGRPDYAYQARVLYADAVAPASVPANGGVVTITGMGFRAGNAVTVNGVSAAVSSWTANTIVATVPSLHALGVATALVADVAVKDLASGGTTVMAGALSYAAPTATLNLIAAPTGIIFLGDAAPFTVRAIAADGLTPLANQSITFTATGATVMFGACAAATCNLLTDETGTASVTVTPQAPGNVTLTATGSAGTQTDVFTAAIRVRTITPLNPTQYIAAGAIVVWTPQVALADNSGSTVGVPVSWSGSLIGSPGTSTTNVESTAEIQVSTGPLASGVEALAAACAWIVICTNFTAIGVDASQWQIAIVSGEGQSVPATGTLAPVVLRVTDAASHPVAGALVEIHQTLDAWQPSCPDHGRCPVPPVYGTSTTTAISTADGLITITPIQIPGVPGVTNVAAATGPSGFISLVLQQKP
jgi:IPT/TIG domain